MYIFFCGPVFFLLYYIPGSTMATDIAGNTKTDTKTDIAGNTKTDTKTDTNGDTKTDTKTDIAGDIESDTWPPFPPAGWGEPPVYGPVEDLYSHL